VAESIVRLRVDASGATRALQGVQRQTNQLQNAFGGLRTAIAGIGIGFLAKQTIFAATNFEKLNQRLKLLTKENGTFEASLDLAREAQQKFGLSTSESLQAVTQLTARLSPLGVGFQEISDILIGFNTAAITSGASMDEQRNAMIQLTQALGSGVLRGDEFNSISEQMNTILPAVAKVMGVQTGELRKMAAQGLITKDVMIEAFQLIAKESGGMLKELIKNDPTMVFKVLGNEVEALSISIGRLLAPVVLDATRLLTKLITELTSFLESEAGQVTLAFVGMAAGVKALSIAIPAVVGTLSTFIVQAQVTAASSVLAATGLKGMAASSFLAAGGVTKAAVALNVFKLALAKTGIGVAVIAFGALATEVLKVINAQREFNRVMEEGSVASTNKLIEETEEKIAKLNEKLKNTNSVSDYFKEIMHGAGSSTMLKHEISVLEEKLGKLQDRLKVAGFEQMDRQAQSTAKALREQNKGLAKNLEINAEVSELQKLEKEHELEIAEIIKEHGVVRGQELILLENQNLELKKQELQQKRIQEEAKRIKGIFKEIGNDIATGISDALVDAIQGTRSLADAARAIINDLATSLLKLGVNTLLKRSFGGIFSNLPGLATGGPASAGRSYLVGERGPEIFTPKSSGTVIPNNMIGGGGVVNNINVSVDAGGGSQTASDSDRGKELGVALAGAIQSELIKQKRPGGLLAT
jgi:tape measure domain-containing protein